MSLANSIWIAFQNGARLIRMQKMPPEIVLPNWLTIAHAKSTKNARATIALVQVIPIKSAFAHMVCSI
jgi:hypothetical protein